MEDIQIARNLLADALDKIKSGESESACWRVADALGFLSRVCPDAMGVSHPTGRGNKLDQSRFSSSTIEIIVHEH